MTSEVNNLRGVPNPTDRKKKGGKKSPKSQGSKDAKDDACPQIPCSDTYEHPLPEEDTVTTYNQLGHLRKG